TCSTQAHHQAGGPAGAEHEIILMAHIDQRLVQALHRHLALRGELAQSREPLYIRPHLSLGRAEAQHGMIVEHLGLHLQPALRGRQVRQVHGHGGLLPAHLAMAEDKTELEGQAARGQGQAGAEGEHLLSPGVSELANGKAKSYGAAEVALIAPILGHGAGMDGKGGKEDEDRAHGGCFWGAHTDPVPQCASSHRMELFTGWADAGLPALFLACLLAATVLPFSSEALLLAMALGPWGTVPLLLTASIGNTLGGMTNYGIGRWLPEGKLLRWLR